MLDTYKDRLSILRREVGAWNGNNNLTKRFYWD
jgi:hypothetical protein